jgi:hypothetical protein
VANAGSEHADRHHRRPLRLAGGDQAAEILARPAGGHRRPRGARVEHVVIDLGSVEAPARDDARATRRVAERGESDMACQPLLAHAFERVGNAVRAEHVIDGDRTAARGRFDRVVQQKDVDGLPPQALEALMDAALDLAGDVVQPRGIEPHLRGQVGLVPDLPEQPAERLLRPRLAVARRRVDPVDPRLHRAPQGLKLGVVILVDQPAADPAAAEHQL